MSDVLFTVVGISAGFILGMVVSLKHITLRYRRDPEWVLGWLEKWGRRG